MNLPAQPAEDRDRITRRHFLRRGTTAIVGVSAAPLWAGEGQESGALGDATAKLEYLTREEDFQNVGRGKPPPHELPPEKRRAVGLAPETWQLEVVPDADSDAQVERPLSKALGTALTWERLMGLAERHAVRFLHVITCTNMPRPLGLGLWEGVPLREIIWLAQPQTNIRRVFYYGYHNDDSQQRFQSSLTIDRVLEDPPGELPVILCYKLNGQWLTPKRGGPVRLIVPGVYGNKSVKWLQRVVLTNNPRLNDTYAEWNNDTESQLKSCASFRSVPQKVKTGQPVPIVGVAQVGMSGLSKVQYWVARHDQPLPADDPYFANGDWQEAALLPAPKEWGGGLPGGKLPPVPLQFDAAGLPRQWPLRSAIALWGTILANLQPGNYDLRCRTIDANAVAQPLPRPFPKSGANAIQRLPLTVEG